MAGIKRTFIACSDGVLEMGSINLGTQRGEQSLQLIWNGRRGFWGRFWFGLFALLGGRSCWLWAHRRRCRRRDKVSRKVD